MICITPERWDKYERDIVFEESYVSEEYGTTTLYFIAPKDIAEGCDTYDTSVEISVEFPTEDDLRFESADAGVSISPTATIDGVSTDYDWIDWDAPYEYINYLLELYYRER